MTPVTLKAVVWMACGWEVVALPTRGRLPTISILCSRHRWLAGLILGGLAAHLLYPIKESL